MIKYLKNGKVIFSLLFLMVFILVNIYVQSYIYEENGFSNLGFIVSLPAFVLGYAMGDNFVILGNVIASLLIVVFLKIGFGFIFPVSKV